MKTIGFISRDDPFHDKVAWSGTIYKLRESIELAGFEVRWVPYGSSMRSKIWEFFLKVWNHFFIGKGTWIPRFHFRPLVKAWAKEIDANPTVGGCDYLFFPLGAQIGLYSKAGKPYINLSGYTVLGMLDYYWFGVNKCSKLMAEDMDAEAARKAIINIRSSHWANDSLIHDYHCEKNTCYVLEFGPYLDSEDITEGLFYKGGRLTILFSGVDWSRKGGDIAVDTVEREWCKCGLGIIESTQARFLCNQTITLS